MSGILNMMLAGGGDKVALVGGSVTSNGVAGGDCTSTYRLTSTGVEQAIATNTSGSVTTALGNWVTPTGNASLYEVFVAVVAGTLTAGSSATGAWLALSSTQSWLVTATGGTAKSADITVQVRDTATSTVRATANVTLEAFA